MSKYHKSKAKQISEYIWMPHNSPNEYPTILWCHIFIKQIPKYICIREMAPIQIIFEGHVIQIFEYSQSSLSNIGKRRTYAVLWINCTLDIHLMHKLAPISILPCCWHYQQNGCDKYWGFKLVVQRGRSNLFLSYLYLYQTSLQTKITIAHSRIDINRVTSIKRQQQSDINRVKFSEWF